MIWSCPFSGSQRPCVFTSWKDCFFFFPSEDTKYAPILELFNILGWCKTGLMTRGSGDKLTLYEVTRTLQRWQARWHQAAHCCETQIKVQYLPLLVFILCVFLTLSTVAQSIRPVSCLLKSPMSEPTCEPKVLVLWYNIIPLVILLCISLNVPPTFKMKPHSP